ncbi:MAG: hypothetical protein II026_10215, partial [Bacteroidales bacterium]|nr:hypothetical protein [Bacteroidales bacterium]
MKQKKFLLPESFGASALPQGRTIRGKAVSPHPGSFTVYAFPSPLPVFHLRSYSRYSSSAKGTSARLPS